LDIKYSKNSKKRKDDDRKFLTVLQKKLMKRYSPTYCASCTGSSSIHRPPNVPLLNSLVRRLNNLINLKKKNSLNIKNKLLLMREIKKLKDFEIYYPSSNTSLSYLSSPKLSLTTQIQPSSLSFDTSPPTYSPSHSFSTIYSPKSQIKHFQDVLSSPNYPISDASLSSPSPSLPFPFFFIIFFLILFI
jgi:hypothetical protein